MVFTNRIPRSQEQRLFSSSAKSISSIFTWSKQNTMFLKDQFPRTSNPSHLLELCISEKSRTDNDPSPRGAAGEQAKWGPPPRASRQASRPRRGQSASHDGQQGMTQRQHLTCRLCSLCGGKNPEIKLILC